MEYGTIVKWTTLVITMMIAQSLGQSHQDRIEEAYKILTKSTAQKDGTTNGIPMVPKVPGKLLPLQVISNLIEVLTDSALHQLTMSYDEYVDYYNKMAETKWWVPMVQFKNYLYPNKEKFVLLQTNKENKVNPAYSAGAGAAGNAVNTNIPQIQAADDDLNRPAMRMFHTEETPPKTLNQLKTLILKLIREYIYIKLTQIDEFNIKLLDTMLVEPRTTMEQIIRQPENAGQIDHLHLDFFYNWMDRIAPTKQIHAADSLEDLLMYMGLLANSWAEQRDWTANSIPVQPLNATVHETYFQELLDLYLDYLQVRLIPIGAITIDQLKSYDRMPGDEFTAVANERRAEDPNGVVPFLYDMMFRIENDVHKGNTIEDLMRELALTAQSYTLTLAERNKRLNIGRISGLNPARIRSNIDPKTISTAQKLYLDTLLTKP